MEIDKGAVGLLTLGFVTLVCVAGALLLFFYPNVPEFILAAAIVFAVGAVVGVGKIISKIVHIKPK